VLTTEPAVVPAARSARLGGHASAPSIRRGRLAGLALGAAGLAAIVVVSLAIGTRDIDPFVVIGALLGDTTSTGAVVVRELRLPRTVLGLVVGIALGLAGMLMQGVTRNPVADPGILGVSAGASLGVVAAIGALGVSEVGDYLWFALLGAAIASLAVYGLGAAGGGRVSPLRLTLAGAVMTMFLSAVTSFVLITDDATLDQFRFWNAGSLAGQDLDVLNTVLPVVAVGVILALAMARALDALALGDDVATALGQRVTRLRILAGVAIVLLAGGAVAVAGPIVFIGLAVPHAARAIVGPDSRWVAAWCMVLGPVLLLGADIIGRVVMRPGELQVGIVTALIGVPVFILLVRRGRASRA
jgi:iron complex transport system permease protein